jgi:hypothetical protein
MIVKLMLAARLPRILAPLEHAEGERYCARATHHPV